MNANQNRGIKAVASLSCMDGAPKKIAANFFELRGVSGIARTGGRSYSLTRWVIPVSLWDLAGCSKSNRAPGLKVT